MELLYVKNVKWTIPEKYKNMKKRIEILEEEYDELYKGIEIAKHEYHSFVLSTIRSQAPQSRTVVLRSFDKKEGSITFHSDIRSKKINDIRSNKNVSALFTINLERLKSGLMDML